MQTTALEAVIDGDAFSTDEQFARPWNGGYPWGRDHNGAVRMAKNCVEVNSGLMTVTAKWLGWVEGMMGHEHYGA